VTIPPFAGGFYMVLFFHKEGYIPLIKPVKVDPTSGREIQIRLERNRKPHRGFLAGVIYKPVRGGKLRFRKGIFGFLKDQPVDIYDENREIKHTTTSDSYGRFLMELPPGRYIIRINKKERTFHIKPNKTTIENLRSGIVLID